MADRISDRHGEKVVAAAEPLNTEEAAGRNHVSEVQDQGVTETLEEMTIEK